jgi:4-amino-4-deoxy-L-arabinose transferase-like glycosyltransferase
MSYLSADARPAEVAATQGPLDGSSESITIPEKSGHEWCVSLLILFLSIAYLRLFYSYTLVNADEGIVLQGAQRILQGEVLYRDFFSFFTPGSYYWMALFLKVFGSSILVGRAVLMVEGGLFSVLTYLLARRVCSRWSALLAAYFVTLTCVPFRFIVLHNWDSTLWACLALYCAVRFLERSRPGWALATGSFASLTCLFEQSKGAGLVLGLSAGFLILGWKERGRVRWDWQRRVALLAGFSGPFLITLIYFGLKHSLPQLLADWFWPLHHYSAINKAPVGFVVLDSAERDTMYAGTLLSRLLTWLITGPWYVVPVLPFLAGFGLTYWSAKAWRGSPAPAKGSYYVLTSAVLMGLLVSTLATGRPDFTHFVYLGPLFFLTLAWIVEGRDIPSSLLHAVRPLLLFFLFLSFTTFGLALLWQPLNARQRLATRRGTLKMNAPDHVVDYVQAHVSAGESMLVYPYLPLYYYLTATHSPGRYEYMMPAFHSLQQFQELVRELAVDHTRVVLFEPSFREKAIVGFPSATPAVLAAQDPVEDYITTHYRACAILTSQNFWRFVFMIRKDLPCPGSGSEAPASTMLPGP